MKKSGVFYFLFYIFFISTSFAQNINPVTNPKSQFDSDIEKTIFGYLGGFYIALSFLHFLLYIFYRNKKTNLFYSLAIFQFAVLFIINTINTLSSDQELIIFFNDNILVSAITLFFLFLLAFIYSLYNLKFKTITILFFIFFPLIVLQIVLPEDELLGFLHILSIPISLVLIIYHSIRMVIIKSENRFMAIVILMFMLVTLWAFIVMIANAEIYIQGISSIFLLMIFLFAIPLSTSIYLAKDIAKTNKNLSKKLIEVEELSAKTIEQEIEKQRMLENQNIILEQQVDERTKEVVFQKAVIEEKNKDIIDSINYAKRIQTSLLPEIQSLENFFPKSFIFYKPKDIVSGDFYWFAEKNGCKILVAADCTGHGVPGALMSMLGINFLNQIVNEKAITQPDIILEQLNIEIKKALKQNNNEASNDGMDIAVLSITDHEYQYAGANRPLYIIQNNQLNEIKPDKFSVGGLRHSNTNKYTLHTFIKGENETLYLFSDGYADQYGGITGKKFMSKNFKELLLKIQTQSLNEQKNTLEEMIIQWMSKIEQTDGILVIGIKPDTN